MAVHQASPDRTLAVWLDSAPDLSCTNSTQPYVLDAEHQPADLAVWGVGSLIDGLGPGRSWLGVRAKKIHVGSRSRT
jgi:hypothetical protein